MNPNYRQPALIVAAICLIVIALAGIYLLARFYFSTSPVTPVVVTSPSATASPTPVESVFPPAASTSATAAWATENHTQTFAGTLPPTPLLTGMRVGSHDGYDRIAFDFKQQFAPGYTIGYVDRAVRDGSGEVVTMPGQATLQIVFNPADAHDSSGRSTVDAPRNPKSTGFRGLQSYAVLGDFEAHVTVALGVSGRNGYQIHELQDGDHWTIYVDVRY